MYGRDTGPPPVSSLGSQSHTAPLPSPAAAIWRSFVRTYPPPWLSSWDPPEKPGDPRLSTGAFESWKNVGSFSHSTSNTPTLKDFQPRNSSFSAPPPPPRGRFQRVLQWCCAPAGCELGLRIHRCPSGGAAGEAGARPHGGVLRNTALQEAARKWVPGPPAVFL